MKEDSALTEGCGGGEAEGHTVKEPVPEGVGEALGAPTVADTVEEADCEEEGV